MFGCASFLAGSNFYESLLGIETSAIYILRRNKPSSNFYESLLGIETLKFTAAPLPKNVPIFTNPY